MVGLGCCLVAVAEKVGAAKTAEEEAAAAIGGDNVVGEVLELFKQRSEISDQN